MNFYNQGIMQSDWTREFLPKICETEFSQTWSFHKETEDGNAFHSRLFAAKSNNNIL